ncbi:TetR/AcrR family transcriptional regulator [Lysobacter sp. A289]
MPERKPIDDHRAPPGTKAGRDVGAPLPAKPAGPGRPKDMAKRTAILDAAKRMFVEHGYAGTSMDQIASGAGVSKLTVYSHFGDKESLFSAAVVSYCDQQLPPAMFTPSPQTPLRERLLDIAHAFHALISSPQAIAAHRMLCTPQMADAALARKFWEAGPQRIHDAVAELLRRRVTTGELVIDAADADSVNHAASQLISLLKGEPHARLLLGCQDVDPALTHAHLVAAVDMFLRAYAARP